MENQTHAQNHAQQHCKFAGRTPLLNLSIALLAKQRAKLDDWWGGVLESKYMDRLMLLNCNSSNKINASQNLNVSALGLRPNEANPFTLNNNFAEEEWDDALNSDPAPQCWLADWYFRNAMSLLSTEEYRLAKLKLRQLLRNGCQEQLYIRPYLPSSPSSSSSSSSGLNSTTAAAHSSWRIGKHLHCREFSLDAPSDVIVVEADGIILPQTVASCQPKSYLDYLAAIITDRAMGIDGCTPCIRIHFTRWSSEWDEWVYINNPRLDNAQMAQLSEEQLDLERPLMELITSRWPDLGIYIENVLDELDRERDHILECFDRVLHGCKSLVLMTMAYLPIGMRRSTRRPLK